MANLVIVCGPQAVGKMTVAETLRDRLGYSLMVNHDTIEVAARIFPFGSLPWQELNRTIRETVFNLAIEYNKDLIFTYVCVFDEPRERAHMQYLCNLFEQSGGSFYFVELSAPLEVRLERNESPHRLERKEFKRNIESSRRELLATAHGHRLNSSEGEYWFENHLKIDNTSLPPEEVATQIIEHFKLGV